MVLMPAVCAFVRQAAPVSESRLTISRTWTPSLIMFSQMVANLALSPLAFWMSEPMLAASKALLSNGRRGAVVGGRAGWIIGWSSRSVRYAHAGAAADLAAAWERAARLAAAWQPGGTPGREGRLCCAR